MTRRKALVLCNAIIVLELLPLAYAHGDYSAAAGANTSLTADNHDPPTLALANMDGDTTSYFHREEHSNTILAHIVLMTVCWVFVLPVGEYPKGLLARQPID